MFPILKDKIKAFTLFGKILIVNALVGDNYTPYTNLSLSK
jgi:hypothetical protein